jgi:hypothetical protein
MEDYKKISNFNINGSILKPRNKSNIREKRKIITNNFLNLRNSDINNDLSFNIKKLLITKNNFFSKLKNIKENISPFKALPGIRLPNSHTPLKPNHIIGKASDI